MLCQNAWQSIKPTVKDHHIHDQEQVPHRFSSSLSGFEHLKSEDPHFWIFENLVLGFLGPLIRVDWLGFDQKA